MIGAFFSINYSRDSLIQNQKTLIRKDSKNEFSVSKFFVGTELSRNDLSNENAPNIKLQSIPAFFADAQVDAQEKSGYGCNFFSLAVITSV